MRIIFIDSLEKNIRLVILVNKLYFYTKPKIHSFSIISYVFTLWFQIYNSEKYFHMKRHMCFIFILISFVTLSIWSFVPEARSSKRILCCESKNKGHYDFECHWRYLFDRWYRIFSAVFFPCSFHLLCLIFKPDIENIPWYLMLFCLTKKKQNNSSLFSCGRFVRVFKCLVLFVSILFIRLNEKVHKTNVFSFV